ncbi:hypothetical protein SPBR_04617 [Sporothrix brasiliensis 5110]|uniref:Uncharacterized protein n=1 Tax=Sporothrix brasiliensis 5110 TaxID=1398154 RepID=A0A0C2IDV6_9PEZI|nr:uncharacterized protein SPBR_04617 [Sporothrix brasiliensis 5110]KIH87456.1 hypothetical protein SPBR_04617 [Sporothrix brasiliensis 5110]
MYQSQTSRGVPIPLPRAVLDAAYPDNPDIVDAHCRLRLNGDAPRWGITAKETSQFMSGWDQEQFTVNLLPIHDGSREPPPPSTSSESDTAPGGEIRRPEGSRISQVPEHASGQNASTPASRMFGSDADGSSAPALGSTNTADFRSSSAPDVLLMTPVEGEDGELDNVYSDGSMAFTLAAAPSSPPQTVPAVDSTSQHAINPDDNISSSSHLEKATPQVYNAETETAIETAVRLIAKARAAAATRYDRAKAANDCAVSATAQIEEIKLPVKPSQLSPSAPTVMIASSSSSSSSSFASVLTAAGGKADDIFFHKMGEDAHRDYRLYTNDAHSDSDSGSDSEEELEALLMQLSDGGGDDSKSTASSTVTITQETADARAAARTVAAAAAASVSFPESKYFFLQQDVQITANAPSEASSETVTVGPSTPPLAQSDLQPPPRPSLILLADDGETFPLSEGTEEDHIQAILRCEEERATGIQLNRDPVHFAMRPPETGVRAAQVPFPYNLGPSCSWAPYFFYGKPAAGMFIPTTTHVGGNGTGTRDQDQVPMPYIEHTNLSDSPLGMPMGTRVINFLPDFGTHSPVRCFLHTSCDGPPPAAVALPMLASLPSFGTATTGARVSTLPTEPPPLQPPPRLSQWNQTRRPTNRESHDARSPTDNGCEDNSRATSLAISEYAIAVGAYKEWTHTCIALHQIAGHVTSSHVEAAATGLADLVRHLVHNAEKMGLLSRSVYQAELPTTAVASPSPTTPVATCYKQVFWAKFVALAFAVFSEHALRMDLAEGASDWAKTVPESVTVEALTIPDRTQTPIPTPLTGRTYRLESCESPANMTPEFWWRHGRQLDLEWETFLHDCKTKQSQPRVYNDDEAEKPYEPVPASARLPGEEDEAQYAEYDVYKDFGNHDGIHSKYDTAEGQNGRTNGDGAQNDTTLNENDIVPNPETEKDHIDGDKNTRQSGGVPVNGTIQEQLVASPSNLNLIAQFTAVRLRGGLRTLANVIYGGGDDSCGRHPIRPDADTVLARAQFDMLQAMADDTVESYARILHWRPREGPPSHKGIRATRQKLARTYRHPLELYSLVM